jgi:RNA polymerase sigma factor (sigma-70 family)
MTRRQTAQVLAHLGVVRHLAAVLGGRLQSHADDLVSAGHLGLVQAVLAFDARRFRPADLRQHLGWKIWVAQIDAVRARDLMRGTYRAWRRGRLAQKPVLLALRTGDALEDDHTNRRGEILEDSLASPDPDPEALVIAADEARADRRRVRGLLAQLSHRDRLIVMARYGHGRRLLAIGRDHHVGESRVCQLATDALHTLRAAAVG